MEPRIEAKKALVKLTALVDYRDNPPAAKITDGQRITLAPLRLIALKQGLENIIAGSATSLSPNAIDWLVDVGDQITSNLTISPSSHMMVQVWLDKFSQFGIELIKGGLIDLNGPSQAKQSAKTPGGR